VVGRVAVLAGAVSVLGALVAAAPGRIAVPACRLAQLTVAKGPELSPATSQNPLALRLGNRARGACALKGYPALTLADARGAIPFVIRHAGDQMVTTSRPRRVVVATGRSAFVVVNKYRCDLGDGRLARRLHIGLPGGAGRRSFRLPAYPRLAYCGARDPGSIIATSPFEPSLHAALRRH
jgi:hypothetical protein